MQNYKKNFIFAKKVVSLLYETQIYKLTNFKLNTYFLSLGSNISPRHHYIDEACRLLKERCGTITRRSSDYFSLPVGYQSEHEYLNICVRLDSALSPFELLAATQQIERKLGRTCKTNLQIDPFTNLQIYNYSDRTIDIDLLQAFVPLQELDFEHSFVPDSALYSELHIHTPALTLPHPRMAERDFVLRPLSEISSHSPCSAPPSASSNL